jgi:SAM-dependent methyltransferase
MPGPNFPTDAFVGTAAFYARYRVPYHENLIHDLAARAGLSGSGALLDLACGPGRLTLPLARFFREVWAVDAEAEMIEAGEREAGRSSVTKIRWSVGRAEEVEAPTEAFELVTIGDAFHRLDQERVTGLALKWLRPGGCLATLGGNGILAEGEAWQRAAMDVVRRWTGRDAGGTARLGVEQRVGPARSTSNPAMGAEHDEGVMRRFGFEEVATYSFFEPHEWTLEGIAGFFYSTSICSKRALSERAAGFEADLRATLLALDPSGVYRESLRFGYTLGRKPAGLKLGR